MAWNASQQKSYWSQVNSVFKKQGVPSRIWEAIAQMESGGNAARAITDSNGFASIGLFQDNLAGQGAQFSSDPQALTDPIIAAHVSAPAIASAYRAGIARHLKGSTLASYVAIHSGHPGTLPLASMQYQGSDPVTAHDYQSAAAAVAKDYTSLRGKRLTLTYNPVANQSTPGGVNGTPSPQNSIPAKRPIGFIGQLDKWLNPQRYGASGISGTVQMIGGRGTVALTGLLFLGMGLYSLMRDEVTGYVSSALHKS